MESVKIITDEQVGTLLNMADLITAVEKGLSNFSMGAHGGIDQPVRSVVSVAGAGKTHHDPAEESQEPGFFGVMPVYSAHDGIIACKQVAFFPSNQRFGKHTHLANISLYNAQFGELKAVMDGGTITAMRTAAASAVASKYLVSTSVQPRKLALLGSGVQARSHAAALKKIFTFSKISVWSNGRSHALKCAEEVGGEASESAMEAVQDADIIVTATFTKTPILMKDWVKRGAHINAVGACRADWQEIDPELMRSAQVYVDSRAGAMKESGDVIISKCHIYAEIGEVINGEKQGQRELLTIFKSLGMAVEDAVAAKLVYDAL